MAQKEVIKLIKKFLNYLNKEGISIQQAYLYGSYAEGNATAESDIDVMLISDIFDKNDDTQIGKVWRISKSVDARIEPYTVGTTRFKKDMVSPLLNMVKQEGMRIQA
ncbi:MAG: nucleotidyltransferase domain-containing protein [Bacteroidia bacterium]